MSVWELLHSWKTLEQVLRKSWRPSLRDPIPGGLPDAGEPGGVADEELPGRWDREPREHSVPEAQGRWGCRKKRGWVC